MFVRCLRLSPHGRRERWPKCVTASQAYRLTLKYRGICNQVNDPLTFLDAMAFKGKNMGPVRALPYPSGRAFQDQWDFEKSLPDRVAQLLERIDYRPAETDEQREQIFRLRYHAYLRDGGICPHPSRAFSDQTTKPATFIFMDYTSIASWRVPSAYTFLPRYLQTALR